MSLPKLIIDSGEPNEIILKIDEYPEYFPKYEIEEIRVYDEELDEWVKTCDYTNEYKSMGIERKVIHTLKRGHLGLYEDGDFHISLMKGRLRDQLARLYQNFKRNKWLLTEGYLINYAVKHPEQSPFAHSIVGHCGRMGIGFKECFDQDDFLLNLYWINRESGSEPFTRTKVKSEGKKLISQLESLADIPGVGKKRAILIAKTLPTMEEIIINRHSLTEINGIGKKSEDAICKWAEEKIKIPE